MRFVCFEQQPFEITANYVHKSERNRFGGYRCVLEFVWADTLVEMEAHNIQQTSKMLQKGHGLPMEYKTLT